MQRVGFKIGFGVKVDPLWAFESGLPAGERQD
jgi:hypothetical protein